MFKRGLLRKHHRGLFLALRITDLVIVYGAGYLAYRIRLGQWAVPEPYQWALVAGVALTLVVFPLFQLYDTWRGWRLRQRLLRLVLAWCTVVLILAFVAFATKTGAQYSRLWGGLWAGLAGGVLLLDRLFLEGIFRAARRRGWNRKRIVIVGAGVLGRNVARHVRETPWLGYDIPAFWDDDPRLWGTMQEGVPVQSTDRGIAALRKNRDGLDEVWLALPMTAKERMREIVQGLSERSLRIRIVPDIYALPLLNYAIGEVAGIPVIDLCASPFHGSAAVVKAVEDRLLAAVILLFASPLMALIAIGVKLSSPGPVLFKQLRHGWDGRPIKVYKFRTMVVHQERKGVTQARRGDPRVTPFGAFLRRTSLDELPQFYNVLQGRMSIVGPRPHAIEHAEMFRREVGAYMQRHYVKPGITGWAQVNGWRGETDTPEKIRKRIEYDLYYIEHWSLWFDLKIIFLTLFRGWGGANAY